MLNYIWGGLIIGSLLFALIVDTQKLDGCPNFWTSRPANFG